MSLVIDTVATAVNLEPGFYIIDSSDQVGPGPYRNPEHANLYKQTSETVAYYSGKEWKDLH